MTVCECGSAVRPHQVSQHVLGKKHMAWIRGIRGPSTRVPPDLPSASGRSTGAEGTPPDGSDHANERILCRVCKKDVRRSIWTQHIESTDHADQLSKAEADKNGIALSWADGKVDFGILDADQVSASEIQSLILNITQTIVHSHFHLTDIRVWSSQHEDAEGEHFSASLLGPSKLIKYEHPRTLSISFRPSYPGRFEDTLELTFEDRGRKCFVITRRLAAIVGSPDDHERLKPRAPYVKAEFSRDELKDPSIPGRRPPTWTETKWIVRLPLFEIPRALSGVAMKDNGRKTVRNRFMPRIFNKDTYGQWFQVLLHVEEEAQSINLQRFNMTDQVLTPKHPRYMLKVPGLVEGKPSVIVGNSVDLKRQGTEEEPWYEGCVHAVLEDALALRMASSFSVYKGNIFNVRFKLNRLPLRRQHQAVRTEFDLERLIFPDVSHISTSRFTEAQIGAIQPHNPRVRGDREQLEALAAIVNQPRGSVPFVIFGPPGTGKTVTVVEAIFQLLARDPNFKILACAPTNLAADLIALALKEELGADVLMRLNAYSRNYKDLPKSLRPFSPVNSNDIFAIPPLEELLEYRVIVCTCTSAGIPHGVGLKRGHFSHVIIDEASQAMEPEAMIPIMTMSDHLTNVILAGDDRQLGPVIQSHIAGELGLRTGYLSRIMSRGTHDLKVWQGVTIVKLRAQYRSHPAIMQWPNQEFYASELRHVGDPSITNSLLGSGVLVNGGFPVVFHGITGKDMREASSPSFFNVDEASLVKTYCLKLIDKHKNLKPSDFGIISPYRAQCGKIQEILPDFFTDTTVGTVEEFQGQERRIIILSTVRSNAGHVRRDINHSLGFVANPRRLNVALTRARAMVIVIGDPVVLSLDPTWRSWLDYVRSNGGWRGKEIPVEPPSDTDDVLPSSDNRDGGVGHAYNLRTERTPAEADVEERMQRLRAHIVRRTEYEGVLNDWDSD